MGDNLAIGLSALCVVHCVLSAMFILVVPLIGLAFVSHALFHEVLLYIVLPISTATLLMGYVRHKMANVLVIGGIGMLTATLAVVLGHALHNEWLEVSLSVAGAVALAWAHWRNKQGFRRSLLS